MILIQVVTMKLCKLCSLRCKSGEIYYGTGENTKQRGCKDIIICTTKVYPLDKTSSSLFIPVLHKHACICGGKKTNTKRKFTNQIRDMTADENLLLL